MTGARIEGQTAAVLCRVAVPIAVAVTVFAGAAQARADSSPGGTTRPYPGSIVPSSVPHPTTAPAPPQSTQTYTPPPSAPVHDPLVRQLDSRDNQPTATTHSTSSGKPAPAAPKQPCPLGPPQTHDKGDHGFFTIKVQSQSHNQFLLTLTFRCYDSDEVQNLTMGFTGVTPGAGQPVKVLSGNLHPKFTGNEDAAKIDDVESYLLDPTVLGAPVSNAQVTNGWLIRITADVAPDDSASRAAEPVVLGTGPGPKPSVLPFHAKIPHSTLPQTGTDVIKIYGVGIVATSIGLYLWYVGALPIRRPKHRA
jgi:hypothetical protein